MAFRCIVTSMFRLFLLLCVLGASANAMLVETVSMPEPTDIPALALGLVGIGYLAWRGRKQPKS